jgi:UDP-glucose 4-epimerase
MKGARVLVTGGAGFIGSHLVDRLGDQNEVTVIDDLSTGTLRNLGRAPRTVHVKRASVLQRQTVTTAMKGQQVVYHLAAKTSVPESVAKPDEYWRTNVEGTVEVLKAAADAGVRRVVFISSAAIYGNSPEMPKVESMRPDPASPYATTKMVGEFACEEIRSLTGIETVVVRLFNAYGPRQDPSAPYSGVMAKFSAAVAGNRPLEIYGDGEQTRDFLFVADIAEGLELAGEKPVNGATLNLGSGEAITVNEVVRILSEIADRPIRAVRKPERPGDIRHSRADVSKAKERLGFTARTSVRKGLEQTLADAKARAPRSS